jgi:hypothetical protein
VAPRNVVKFDAKTSIKSRQKGRQKSRQKDDHCVDYKLLKGRQKVAKKDDKKVAKGQPIAAVFNCVFLDTKERKSGSLFICIHYCDNLF